jgi:hypothetical protein
VPQLAEPAIATVLQSQGADLAELLPQFAKDNYFLAYSASDVSTWRDLLNTHSATEGDSKLGYAEDLAPARPARTRVDLTDGLPYGGASLLHPGGSSYAEFVPVPDAAGQLTVTLTPSSYLGSLTDLDARLLLVASYPADGAPTYDEVLITLDPSSGGSVSVGMGTPYRYAVLILTETNPVSGSDDWVNILATFESSGSGSGGGGNT